ncbi:unnamed protein product [Cuscuta campestris]|uniref:Uncharacterized protein n=1 Tax=Cuscuta campestris TaxID=132261 RepID=A0A484MG70_9ASTE|nr:unnamed protein product [Cuscuta campestris]
MGHLAKHCRGAVLSSLEPEDYPFDASLRAGGRKKEPGLGLPWLRFQDPWVGCGKQVGTSSLVQKVIPEEEVELEVVAKRKRGTEGGAMLGRDLDISMMDGSKNLQAAALHLGLDRAVRVHRVRRFWFENAWMPDTGFKDVLTKAWRDSTREPFSNRLDACGKRLMRWGGDKFQHFGKRRKELEKLIGGIRGKRDDQSLLALNRAEKELACLRHQEDLY